jgi:hypothetical protein
VCAITFPCGEVDAAAAAAEQAASPHRLADPSGTVGSGEPTASHR